MQLGLLSIRGVYPVIVRAKGSDIRLGSVRRWKDMGESRVREGVGWEAMEGRSFYL